MESGEEIFEQKCTACHTIGGGSRVGPDLKGVTEQRERSWLVEFISAPDAMFRKRDPIALRLSREYGNARMPNLGLSRTQVNAVVDYLAEAARAPAPAQRPEAAAARGNPRDGERLFRGLLLTENNGPACMSCHSISGAALLGGGTLGPDLTHTYSKFGDAGTSALLASLSFPVMRPIYQDHPLTPKERADMKSFFKEIDNRKPVDKTPDVAAITIVLFLIFLVLIGVIWRNRLRAVRESLVEKEGADRS
ncbi:MAG TPA: c-type cytochrome [Geobacteraceae bacterium]